MYLKQVFEITINAKTQTKTGLSALKLAQKFVITQICDPASADIKDDIRPIIMDYTCADPEPCWLQQLTINNVIPPKDAFQFFQFSTFASGCPILKYKIVTIDLVPIPHAEFSLNELPAPLTLDPMSAQLADQQAPRQIMFKLIVEADGGHTKTFPINPALYYQIELACFQKDVNIVTPAQFKEYQEYEISYLAGIPVNPPMILNLEQNSIYDGTIAYQNIIIQRKESASVYQIAIPEFKTNNDLCLLKYTPFTPFYISEQLTDHLQVFVDQVLIDTVSLDQINRQITVIDYHLQLKDVTLTTFYLHTELELVKLDASYTQQKFNKYVSIKFNVQIVCQDEEMIYPPKPIDLVYSRISKDSLPIKQELNKTSPMLNNIILLPLNDTLQQQFETTLKQCPVYSYELFTKVEADDLDVYNNDTHIKIDNKIRDINDEVLDVWKPAVPQIVINDKYPTEITLFLKGETIGKKKQIVQLNIWVCGSEKNKVIKKQPFEFVLKYKDEAVVEKWEELDKTFEFSNNTVGHDLCEKKYLKLYDSQCNDDKNITLACTEDYLWNITSQIELIDLVDNKIQQTTQELNIYGNQKISRTKIFIQRETYGEISNKTEIYFTVCGNEHITLINPSDFYEVEIPLGSVKYMYNIDFFDRFQSSDVNCPVYQFELLPLDEQNGINPKFKMDQINAYFLFDKAPAGEYEVLLHPSSHSYAQSLPIKIIIREILPTINQPPFFDTELDQVKLDMRIDKEFNYFYQNGMLTEAIEVQYTLQLPQILDLTYDFDQIKITMKTQKFEDIGSIKNSKRQGLIYQRGILFSYDADLNQLKFKFTKVEEIVMLEGINMINIELTDQGQESNKYQTSFEVRLPQIIPLVIFEDKSKDLNKSSTYCQAQIKEISKVGIMKIGFSKLMNFTETQNINKTNIEMFIQPYNDWTKEEEQFNINLLNFTWEVWKFQNQSNSTNLKISNETSLNETKFENETILLVNLTFNSPPDISQMVGQDFIVVNILDHDIFMSVDGEELEFKILYKKIQRQMENSEYINQFIENNENSRLGMVSALVANLLLSLLAPGGLTYLVSMLNSLQIVLHLPILGVQEPANVLDTFSQIIPIVGFDVIEAFDIPWLKLLMHKQDEDLDVLNICDQVISLGYETHNPVLNIGFMSILINLYFIKLALLILVIFPIYKYFGKIKKLTKQIIKQLFFEEILIIFIEGHMELLLAGIIIVNVPKQNQDNNNLTLSIGYFFLFGTLIMIPILFLWMSTLNLNYILSRKFKRRFKFLIEDISTKNKGQAMYFGIFIMRRIIYMACFVFLVNYPTFQLQILLLMNKFCLIYQGSYKPQSTRLRNRIENLNEFLVSIASYHMMFYSDWVDLKKTSFMYGFLQIDVVYFIIGFNMIFVIYYSLRGITLLSIKVYNNCCLYFNQASKKVSNFLQNSSLYKPTLESKIQSVDQAQHKKRIQNEDLPQIKDRNKNIKSQTRTNNKNDDRHKNTNSQIRTNNKEDKSKLKRQQNIGRELKKEMIQIPQNDLQQTQFHQEMTASLAKHSIIGQLPSTQTVSPLSQVLSPPKKPPILLERQMIYDKTLKSFVYKLALPAVPDKLNAVSPPPKVQSTPQKPPPILLERCMVYDQTLKSFVYKQAIPNPDRLNAFNLKEKIRNDQLSKTESQQRLSQNITPRFKVYANKEDQDLDKLKQICERRFQAKQQEQQDQFSFRKRQ